jgi:hypothetical protein
LQDHLIGTAKQSTAEVGNASHRLLRVLIQALVRETGPEDRVAA